MMVPGKYSNSELLLKFGNITYHLLYVTQLKHSRLLLNYSNKVLYIVAKYIFYRSITDIHVACICICFCDLQLLIAAI